MGPWLDRNLFGAEHLGYGQDTLAYDPMGVVALLPAIALTLLGYSACQTFIERMRKSEGSARVGLLASALIGIGWILGRWVPIVPSEWTAPYALIAAGWGLLGCALWHELVTGVGWTALAHPFRILGRNAILVYAGGVLTMDLAGRITVPSDEGGKVHLLDWFANAAWRSWASEPVAAVLLALTVLGVWWLVALALAKGKVYISL
ncbi:MAG: putative acyltransferase [Planctomycetota bacterium]